MTYPSERDDDQRKRHAKRLQEILELLQGGTIMRTSDLAVHFDVVERTIHRDVVALREMGHVIDGSPGAGGGIRLKTAKNAVSDEDDEDEDEEAVEDELAESARRLGW